jgi:hypothetical protein
MKEVELTIYPKVTNIDLDIIDKQTFDTLADWHYTLSYLTWPETLPNPEAVEYFQNKQSRRKSLLHLIHSRIGNYKILRRCNSTMTDTEFNTFWRSTFEGDLTKTNNCLEDIAYKT